MKPNVSEPVPPTGRRLSPWDLVVLRIADIPWGLAIAASALLFIAFGGKEGLAKAGPMLTAAGLFGVGHGIHTAAKIKSLG
jgi:hypothetical protein